MNLIPFRKNGLFGFCDAAKKMVIEPQYLNVQAVVSGLASVQNTAQKWGLIDETNRVIFDFLYSNPFYFDELGQANMQENGQIKTFNRLGEVIFDSSIPVENVSTPTDAVYFVNLGEQTGVRRQDGKWLIPLGEIEVNASLALMGSDYFSIYKLGKCVIYDMEGREFYRFEEPETFIYAQYLYDDRFFVSKQHRDTQLRNQGILRLPSGEMVVPFQENLAIPPGKFDENTIILKWTNENNVAKTGWINLKNELLQPLIYAGFDFFLEKYVIIFDGDQTNPILFDQYGTRISPEMSEKLFEIAPIFDGFPDHDLRIFRNYRRETGILNIKTEEILFKIRNDFGNYGWPKMPFHFFADAKMYVFDAKGQPIYEGGHIDQMADSTYFLGSDALGNRTLMSPQFQPVFLSKKAISEIKPFGNDAYFWVIFKNKTQSVFRADGKEIKLPPFDFVGLGDGFFIFSKYSSNLSFAGSTDLNGKIIVPCVHANTQFVANKSVFSCFERFFPQKNNNYEGASYWVDFQKNIVYREELKPLPTPEDFKPKNMQDFKIGKPTDQMRDRAPYFSPETADILAKILDNYIDELIEITQLPIKKRQQPIRDCVKKLIFACHDFNENHQLSGPPLETSERDDLVSFALTVAQAAGLDTTEDITEPYREF